MAFSGCYNCKTSIVHCSALNNEFKIELRDVIITACSCIIQIIIFSRFGARYFDCILSVPNASADGQASTKAGTED